MTDDYVPQVGEVIALTGLYPRISLFNPAKDKQGTVTEVKTTLSGTKVLYLQVNLGADLGTYKIYPGEFSAVEDRRQPVEDRRQPMNRFHLIRSLAALHE
jgi:hypothetical protein